MKGWISLDLQEGVGLLLSAVLFLQVQLLQLQGVWGSGKSEPVRLLKAHDKTILLHITSLFYILDRLQRAVLIIPMILNLTYRPCLVTHKSLHICP